MLGMYMDIGEEHGNYYLGFRVEGLVQDCGLRVQYMVRVLDVAALRGRIIVDLKRNRCLDNLHNVGRA